MHEIYIIPRSALVSLTTQKGSLKFRALKFSVILYMKKAAL